MRSCISAKYKDASTDLSDVALFSALACTGVAIGETEGNTGGEPVRAQSNVTLGKDDCEGEMKDEDEFVTSLRSSHLWLPRDADAAGLALEGRDLSEDLEDIDFD